MKNRYPAMRPLESSLQAVRRSSAPAEAGTPTRSGVTLIEVLMSVLLTGFGVVTIAALFPISVMRTVQATHLTHATALRFNAEARIDMFPTLVNDPNVNGNTAEHDGTIYVVDPLGRNTVGTATWGTLPRFNGGIGSEAAARAFVTLPDSYISQVEDTPLSSTALTVTMPGSVDLTTVAVGGTTPSRVILFDTSGRASEVRTIAAIAGQTITWTTPLPAGFNVMKARIETREDRYSWLLTVRNRPSGSSTVEATVTVVVYYKRSLTADDELVYTANFQQDVGTVTVTWPTAADKPFYKEGGFVFDVVNARWYGIQKIEEGTNSATLTLDRPALESSTAAMLMRGIVEVYPIGGK